MLEAKNGYSNIFRSIISDASLSDVERSQC